MLLKCLGFRRSKHTSPSPSKKHYPTVIEELCHHFSPVDLRKSTNNFDKKLIIGRGGFGIVYKGFLQHNGDTDYTVAIKQIRYGKLGEFKNEIELLCQLRHPNLIPLLGFCNHKEEKILVYEYMANGSLHDRLYCRDMKVEQLSWNKRLEICIGAAGGLHYLHTGAKRIILHRDIKPRNILLDNNMVPKLSHFGLSLQGPLFTSKPKPIPVPIPNSGTFGYMAPEYFKNYTVTDRFDVYSFGVVLLEMVCVKDKQTLFDKMTELKQNLKPIERYDFERSFGQSIVMHIQSIVHRFPVEEIIEPILMGKIAPECWEVFMDITERCLKFDPNERPTMGEVEVQLEHALSLQEEADIRNTNDDYTLLSNTIIKRGLFWV